MHKRMIGLSLGIGFFIAMIAGDTAFADTRTATTSGNWSSPGTWNTSVPLDGEAAVINSGVNVTVDVVTATLTGLTNNGTLNFSGWNNVVSGGVVTVSASGTITSFGPSANGGATNRVWIVASSVEIVTGGKIDVNGKGYQGAAGPGAGFSDVTPSGGGYGGIGGKGTTFFGGTNYGSASLPEALGSGGGLWGGHAGGLGGGAVRIDASGSVTVNGAITANGLGGLSGYGAGGSGGSILITCDTFQGAGSIAVAGGSSPAGAGYDDPGGGGGGRISINYISGNQAALGSQPTCKLAADGGVCVLGGRLIAFQNGGAVSTSRGQSGTIYLTDNVFFPTETITSGFQSAIPGFTSWAPTTLTISNAWVEFGSGFQLTVGGDLKVMAAGGRLDIRGTALDCAGSVVLTNGGSLFLKAGATPIVALSCTNDLVLGGLSSGLNRNWGGSLLVFSALTNGATPVYGAAVNVGRDILVSSNGVIYPFSHNTNGGSVRITVSNLTVALGGKLDADGRGFRGDMSSSGGFGPGGSANVNNAPGGASYGGFGGSGAGVLSQRGRTYGSTATPTLPGSGGGGYGGNLPGDDGGGLVWVEASGRVIVNGVITANGVDGIQYAGGGSGGGIYIVCQTITGGGRMQANGSDGNITTAGGYNDNGGGGGGRISVNYNGAAQLLETLPTVRFSAAGGLSWQGKQYALFNGGDMITSRGEPGTVYMTDTNFFPGAGGLINDSFCPVVPGMTNWHMASLTVTGVYMKVANMALTVDGDVKVNGLFSRLDVVNGKFTGGGNLLLTNSAQFHAWAETGTWNSVSLNGRMDLYSGGTSMPYNVGCYASVHAAATNNLTTGYGARFSVGGELAIHTNCAVFAYTHPSNAAIPLLQLGKLTVDVGGSLDAVGKGYAGATGGWQSGGGPSGGGASGDWGAGGGHAGTGGTSGGGGAGGAVIYGVSNAPVTAGSGGGSKEAGGGGGVLRIVSSGPVTVNGTVDASGANAGYVGGGGAGGSVYITAKNFSGNGLVRAKGGNGGPSFTFGGGGGGGRIAIYSQGGAWTGTLTTNQVLGGSGYVAGGIGSLYWVTLPASGSLMMVR